MLEVLATNRQLNNKEIVRIVSYNLIENEKIPDAIAPFCVTLASSIGSDIKNVISFPPDFISLVQTNVFYTASFTDENKCSWYQIRISDAGIEEGQGGNWNLFNTRVLLQNKVIIKFLLPPNH